MCVRPEKFNPIFHPKEVKRKNVWTSVCDSKPYSISERIKSMNGTSYVQHVKSAGAFWRGLKPWVKALFVLFGLLIGLWVWFAGFSASFPLIALIFLGTGTPALVMKVLVVLGIIVSLIIVVLVTWLFYLLVYAISYLVIMANENASMGDFIFKTDKK